MSVEANTRSDDLWLADLSDRDYIVVDALIADALVRGRESVDDRFAFGLRIGIVVGAAAMVAAYVLQGVIP